MLQSAERSHLHWCGFRDTYELEALQGNTRVRRGELIDLVGIAHTPCLKGRPRMLRWRRLENRNTVGMVVALASSEACQIKLAHTWSSG